MHGRDVPLQLLQKLLFSFVTNDLVAIFAERDDYMNTTLLTVASVSCKMYERPPTQSIDSGHVE